MDDESSKKPLSPQKIEANRRNSAKSTGPRTLRGKKNSRLNSLRHGLLAKSVVILEGSGRENAAEFVSLLNNLGRDLQPVGTLEELLVNQIAACYWRLDRGLRCEVGELRRSFADRPMSSFFESLDAGGQNPERDAISSHLNIPSENVLGRILRHETAIHRQLNQAMNHLERLQRQRKAAAPVSTGSNGQE